MEFSKRFSITQRTDTELESTDMIHTYVEGAGGMGSFKLKLQQGAGLRVMSQPQGHTEDYSSCKLQHTTHVILSVHLISTSTLHYTAGYFFLKISV